MALAILVRILIAVVVVAIVAGGVFAYGVWHTRTQIDPNRQAAWAERSATAVAVSSSGDLYVAFLREIYRIDPSTGASTLVAGRASDPGSSQPAAAEDGQPAVGAAIRPVSLAVGPAGQVFFGDQLSETVRTIRSGVLQSVGRAGEVGGVAVDDTSGTLYFTDQLKDQVFKVTLQSGAVATVAGSGQGGFAGDGAAATRAQLAAPNGLAVAGGQLLIADSGNNRVREVDLKTGVISTVAGDGKQGFVGDGGPAAHAQLTDPVAVAQAPNGGYVIADQGDHRLRAVSSDGALTTLAGSGDSGYDGPNGSVGATSSHLPEPSSLVYLSSNLYFVDNFQLRVLSGGRVSFYTPPGSPS